ncbi:MULTISPECIES: NAD(P)/FAD-dependent oxidoreductase [unclassified Leptolyngbya]|uniref:flavin monoamine oxidase family protein n=1 Tax=unclassified Leptolyngbya TaxID=2650499 RepID=UPI001685AF06|nr:MULTISPECIES: NAD(P)/FAD-dependent oxidoreductase [unclassified Leptolyngbya]MBD1912980.1 FAD-dependent oxidoreductase [Leptolyngbya sp. FACHB-8]MBD2155709.1 FAD-dependent oxidoreductase [Leptolyngbya sp. FACHB-16]
MARSQIIQILRRAYQTIGIATKQKISIGEAEGLLTSQSHLSRREFLYGSLVTGATLGLRPKEVTQVISNPKILVVGAGVAGLTVAYRLQQAGIAVDLVDASQRVGGRLRSLRDWPGCPNPVELGGEFIDTRHTAVHALVQELGLPLADLREADRGLEAEVFFFNGQRVSHKAVIDAFIPLAEKLNRDLAAIGDATPNYRNANRATQALDRLSLDAYLDTVDIDPMIRDLVRVAYITEYGRDSGDQTCLNMLFLIGTESGQWSTYGTSDERWHVIGGNEQIPKTLAQRLRSPIQSETVLESIRETDTGTYQVSLRQGATSRERTYEGVVLAVPFTVLRQVELAVKLPPAKRAAIAQLGYGTSTKLVVPLRERIWRNRYGSTISVYTDQAFQNTWESARYTPGSSGWITNLRGGAEGIRLGEGTPEAQGDRLIRSLSPLFPGIDQVQRGQALRAYWAAEPYALGSYSCYRPGQWTQFGGAEAEPVGNLWFAGEHCSLSSQGYINGAVESAEVAAQQVLKTLRGQSV